MRCGMVFWYPASSCTALAGQVSLDENCFLFCVAFLSRVCDLFMGAAAASTLCTACYLLLHSTHG